MRYAKVARLLSLFLIAVGFVLLAVAMSSDEGVNESGFVPGVGVGYIAIAGGGIGVLAANRLEKRLYARVAMLIGYMAWFVSSTLLWVWGTSILDALSASSFAGLTLAVLAWFGFAGALFAVVMVVLAPAFHLVAWLADRVPTLRKHNVGDGIRRQVTGNW